MDADTRPDLSVPREGYVPVNHAELYYREVGQGRPLILLHGGPDFDHSYLLPDMDRLADSYRLIYYDQRGRGKSARGVSPDDVSIQTEIDDLEHLRAFLQLDSVALLGHSWGGVLALAYAIQHSDRMSHLILMNTAAASHDDYLVQQQEVQGRKAVYAREITALSSSAAFQRGDPDAVAAYYRLHFSNTIQQPQHLERLIASLKSSFTKEGVLKGRAIEDRLIAETWSSREFNLCPALGKLSIPTLVIHGDYDFIPKACAVHIAQAIPGARFVLLSGCGHFAYIASPDDIRKEIADFFSA
jgi:proline iminopeptidase